MSMLKILMAGLVVLCCACGSQLGLQDPTIPVDYELTVEWTQAGPAGPFNILWCWWEPALSPGMAAIVFSQTSQSLTMDNWDDNWTQIEPWFAPPGGGNCIAGEPFEPGWEGWAALVVWDGWDGIGEAPLPASRSNVVMVPLGP